MPKSGTSVIQALPSGEVSQLWALEYQGKNLFFIRSALGPPKFYLSVRDNSLKSEADIVVITISEEETEAECFWRILGAVPTDDASE
jgi:hypothetical protein